MKSPPRGATKGAREGSTEITATSTQPTAPIRSSRLTRTGLGWLSDGWTRMFFYSGLRWAAPVIGSRMGSSFSAMASMLSSGGVAV